MWKSVTCNCALRTPLVSLTVSLHAAENPLFGTRFGVNSSDAMVLGWMI
jgi:hypothetical protein